MVHIFAPVKRLNYICGVTKKQKKFNSKILKTMKKLNENQTEALAALEKAACFRISNIEDSIKVYQITKTIAGRKAIIEDCFQYRIFAEQQLLAITNSRSFEHYTIEDLQRGGYDKVNDVTFDIHHVEFDNIVWRLEEYALEDEEDEIIFFSNDDRTNGTCYYAIVNNDEGDADKIMRSASKGCSYKIESGCLNMLNSVFMPDAEDVVVYKLNLL